LGNNVPPQNWRMAKAWQPSCMTRQAMNLTGRKRWNQTGAQAHRRNSSCFPTGTLSGLKTKWIELSCLALAFILAGTGCGTGESRFKRIGVRPKGPDAVLGRTTLHSAPNWSMAERLIREGADVNARDSFGMTPLHTAVRAGRHDVVEVLIARGADVNARSDRGQTPLFCAAAGESRQIAEHLIAHGADVNAKDNYGMTPLHGAAHAGRTELVELLISKGAEVNATCQTGMTPLHCAAAAGHEGAVRALLAAGADAGIKDNEGRTPLDWAESSGHTEIAELLRRQGAKE